MCVLACPKHNLALGKDYNAQGYAYVTFNSDGKCTGCAFCAELCPDMALRVYKRSVRDGPAGNDQRKRSHRHGGR